MTLPSHKTKIVCTIGPASRPLPILEKLIRSGMNVARLNFSHSQLSDHRKDIRNIQQTAARLGKTVGILIDLPGAKIRLGKLGPVPVILKKGERITLTTGKVPSGSTMIPVEYKQLPQSVRRGNVIYINDGFIQLKVEKVKTNEVICQVLMGGPLGSHKGLNLPGAQLFVKPVTRRDLSMVDFGLRHGVHVFGLSFVERAEDILKVREFAKARGKTVFLVAKIEREEAIKNFDEIAEAADAIMIARGDLGVEVPIQEVPVIQKRLIQKANVMGKPVITATQMLESMTDHIRPTRAEVNDVANAILDGTDAVMLSGETAVGQFPSETVKIMGQIAAYTEQQRAHKRLSNDEGEMIKAMVSSRGQTITDVISINVVGAAEKLKAHCILTSTASGSTARRVSRFKPGCWIFAFSTLRDSCNFLVFSYGVYPFFIERKRDRSLEAMIKTIKRRGLAGLGHTVIITERRLSPHEGVTDSMDIITLE